MQNPPPGYTRVCPYLLYEDATSAAEYLTAAFGFVCFGFFSSRLPRLRSLVIVRSSGLICS